MSYTANIGFIESDFDAFTGGAIGTPLTEKQGALLSSALSFLMTRYAWQDMTDSEWDAWDNELSELMELITP